MGNWMLGNKSIKKDIENLWPYGAKRKDKIEDIENYYKVFNKDEYGDIDKQTFFDLNLDKLYTKINGTYSTAGADILYKLLKKQVRNKETLDERTKVMEYFKDNEEERIEVQTSLYKLGKDKNHDLVELLSKEYKGNNLKKNVYFFLGVVCPILLIGLAFINPFILYGFILLLVINSVITGKEKAVDKPRGGIIYGAKLIKCAKEISMLDIEGMKKYKKEIDDIFESLGSDINKLNKAKGVITEFYDLDVSKVLLEIFETLFLTVDRQYYKIIDRLNERKFELKKLYDILGEIDALIAVAGYQEWTEYEITKPNFEKNCGFKIIEGAHPLVEDVVRNSINIDKKGIVLTGTNMSGKSTFLRMLGVNIVLAQSFNFVHAKEYKSEFLNYISSISLDDDVENGKSYYMAEGEAVLRIINALDGEYKVFCGIDEIFRGTNPTERIVASKKILEYIQKRNSISIVATHDNELTQMLKKTHSFNHFSEEVSDSEGLTFDYKLKEGVLKTRNAIKLLNYIGYPHEIIDGAYRFIEENLG